MFYYEKPLLWRFLSSVQLITQSGKRPYCLTIYFVLSSLNIFQQSVSLPYFSTSKLTIILLQLAGGLFLLLIDDITLGAQHKNISSPEYTLINNIYIIKDGQVRNPEAKASNLTATEERLAQTWTTSPARQKLNIYFDGVNIKH